ncbi:MAG: MBL fold metallo-hydrolase [Elusimicrobia bacterium GWA2_56_46]|nr:MAG: MBL fold metallo-hydrolase [Elusimicrobia bacterium GWA2_56_46]OGR53692.1 MAG: MBL fold metallo-hydrolase [Elusimicrobia bacterium GWC2_56_31]HBB66813.1 MBL fold metallo-hydrolase [Elusimicrobiota bacterium]HBW23169.1 MBL fold metallo-hydrolase [Elusimicrobiota bacterium]
MEIIFLGTNGWYDTAIANSVCVLVKTREYDIVLDAGNGIYKLDRYVDGKKPVYLFLSHFHLDHIAGLHILVKFNFKAGLTICAGKGARKTLNAILRRPFTVPLNKLKFKTRVLELPAQAGKIPFAFKSLPLVHADPVLGYRFELDGRILAYCTDTGYCENSVKLAKGADLLISECAHRPGESNPVWPHMNPANAAALANEAGVKKLALVHFGADRYPLLKDRLKAGKIAKKTFKNTFVSRDGMRIKLV